MGCSSSRTAPVWVPSTGCTPSGTGCSSMDPPRGRKPCQKTCPGMDSSLHGPTGSSRSLLQCGSPHGVTASFRHPPAPAWGPFHRLQVDICSTVDSMGCRMAAFSTGCRGTCAPVPGVPPPSPSSLALVSAALFLSHHLTPLSWLPFHHRFFPLLYYVILAASHRSHRYSPPATKTLPRKPTTHG